MYLRIQLGVIAWKGSLPSTTVSNELIRSHRLQIGSLKNVD